MLRNAHPGIDRTVTVRGRVDRGECGHRRAVILGTTLSAWRQVAAGRHRTCVGCSDELLRTPMPGKAVIRHRRLRVNFASTGPRAASLSATGRARSRSCLSNAESNLLVSGHSADVSTMGEPETFKSNY
jgi:hypothetical protein